MEGTILLLSMEECCSEILLPQDILIKILLRLPVKVLARFKCVSKSWLSLISDPYFARSHFDLSLAPTHTPLLSLDGTLEIASIDFNAPSIHDYTTKLLKLPIPQLSHLSDDDDEFEITGHLSDDDDSDSDQFEITVPDLVGSCRGLILFRCDLDLCIWNPCTGLQRRIPSPPIYMNAQCEFLCGFGYDSSIDDYLVTLGSYDNTGAETHVIVAIFSVRTNTWKQFDGIISETLKYACVDFFLGGVFFNGANHWIASGGEASMVDVIVAFDLTERVFSEIALPDGLDNTRCRELRVIGGFLSVCPYMLDGFNDAIWVMEEYKVQSSWKSLSFSTPNFPYMLLPICLTGEGDFVGIEDDFTKLVKLNYKGEELESCDYDDFPNPKGARCVVVMHTQSLLSLPCHTLQAEDI